MGRIGINQILSSAEEMISFGKEFAKSLSPNAIVALSGDLGSGKTTFVQGLAIGLNIFEPVQSPTFTTLHIYEGLLPLFHFDLYRLKRSADFISQGFDEYFCRGGICAIEWPERIVLPSEARTLSFRHIPQGRLVVSC